MKDITYTITRQIAVLSSSVNGWSMELNEVSWNGAAPKLDLHRWGPGHVRQGKGVTLTRSEAAALCQALAREVENDRE